MQDRKLTIVPLLLIFALVLTGFAYAHWSKTILISGEIDTGKVDAIITSWFCDDSGIDPGYDKDVASCECSIDTADPQKAYVTITNAYPCYTVHGSLTVKNTGTIPIALKEVRVDGKVIPEEEWTPIDADNNGAYDLEFYMINSLGEQVDPGKEVETSLIIHVMEGAEPRTTYEFTIEFDFWNWNEVP